MQTVCVKKTGTERGCEVGQSDPGIEGYFPNRSVSVIVSQTIGMNRWGVS